MPVHHCLKHAIAGALLAATLLAPAGSWAAPRGSNPDAPSYVDLTRVLAEYQKSTAFAKHGQKLREQSRVYSEEMEVLSKLRYNTEAERKEALALKARGKLTEKEQARFDELMKKSDAIDNEAAALSQKGKPTEAEAKRIQELSQIRSEALKGLAKEEADRRDSLRKLDSQLREEVENELLKHVEKVARDQKLPCIYERRAVLFGGNDLTDEVIKRLPK